MSSSFLYDKKIWITGASSGIGLAIVNLLNSKQNTLLLTSKNVSKLRESTRNIKGNSKIYLFPFDVASTQMTNDAFEFIVQEVGYPDILINNAGIYIEKSFINTTSDDFDNLININLKGYFNTTKCVLPAMVEQNGGAIVNIISVTAIESYTNCSIYSASKAAILSMMNCLREEVKNHNIKIINIMPGAVATDIWNKKFLEKFKAKMALPTDVANTVISALELCDSNQSMIETIKIKPQITFY